MRHDGAGYAGAMAMWAFLAAERIKGACNRIRKFRMPDVDSGIDNGDGNVGAMRQRMRLGQSKFQKRILGGIALGDCRLLVLQRIAEVRLHPANAVGCEFAAYRLHRPAVNDAEQADGGAYERKVLRSDALEPMTPRQFVGLRVGQRAVDLGHDFACDRARIEDCLRKLTERAAVPILVLAFAR